MPAAALGALVKRDAAIVLAALITLTLLAWLVLLPLRYGHGIPSL